MRINYIFENESCFKNNRVVNLNIFVVINPFENLKRAMDSPQKKKKIQADVHTVRWGNT